MDIELFWRLVESARRTVGGTYTAGYDERIGLALKAELVQLPPDEIMAFDNQLIDVGAAARSLDMEAAAHLVANIFFDGWHGPRYYCFINAVIMFGRETFERAAQSPDSLADHPAILAVAAGELPRVALIAQEIYDVAGAAYCEVEGVTVNEYLGRLWHVDDADGEGTDEDDEDDWGEDEEDDSYYDKPYDKRWKQRLPHLMTVFRRPGPVNQVMASDGKVLKSDGTKDKRRVRARPRRDEPAQETDAVYNAVLGQNDGGWWRRWRRS